MAAVLVPGWGGYKFDEHLLQTLPVYHGAGYGVLLLDLRAQGESDGARRTLGYREVRDVRGALAWLQQAGLRGGERRAPRLVHGRRDRPACGPGNGRRRGRRRGRIR